MGGFDYTVKNNDKGLSYIFLEEAKKQAGFDANKKINWNKVINVFKEIQKEEQAEGQRLYRGGNPNLIWKGDKISLSESQMNRIYEAMGVELSASQPAEPDTVEPEQPQSTEPPTTETPETPQAEKPQDIPKADPNPPYKEQPPQKANKSDIPKDRYIPLELEYTVPHISHKLEKKVKNPDGTSYSYDYHGYIYKVYDSAGNCTRDIFRYYNGDVDYCVDYEYDSAGNRTRAIKRYSDGRFYTYYDYEYDSAGNCTRAIKRYSSGDVDYCVDYEYDSAGNRTREINRNSDGSVYKYYDYEYDSAGNRTREIHRNSDGSVVKYIDYEYDSAGNPTRVIHRNPDGSVR